MNARGVGYLIKRINDKLKVKADADLKRHELTLAQSRVLAFLNSEDGRATQKEIEDFLEVSHPTVVGIVSRMEQNGFVTAWLDPENRRNKIVQLTESSHEIGADLDRTIQEQESSMLRGLSQAQISELEKMLTLIYKNLD